MPEGADVAAFLLSDGRALAKPTLPKMRTLKQLLDAYMAAIPAGSIEPSTRQGMDIHIAHLRRVLGDGLIVAGLSTTDLQRFVDARALCQRPTRTDAQCGHHQEGTRDAADRVELGPARRRAEDRVSPEGREVPEDPGEATVPDVGRDRTPDQARRLEPKPRKLNCGTACF